MQFSLKEITDNLKDACLLYKTDDFDENKLFSISTDTRKIQNGDCYLPLRGENFDGHNFIDKAIELGAIGYFTQDKYKVNKNAKFVIYVKNSLNAYLELAQYIRTKINPYVIAVTGSCGKTTTKEMLYEVFSTEKNTHKTHLNHNNEIGFCETLFSMPVDCEVLILEMGMRNLGEIELLSKHAKPDIGIISNIGSAHVEKLGTLRNIAIAKCEIVAGLKQNGTFIGVDCSQIKDNLKFSGKKIYTNIKNASNIEIEIDYTKFTYENNDFVLSVAGEYNVQNAILAIEAGKTFGLDTENIKKGLKNYKPIEKRWEKAEVNGLVFINDSYNANPESMNAVLKTFLSIYKFPLVLVLGDMAELGKDDILYHKQIGEFLSGYKDILLLTVGDLARHIARNCTLDSVQFSNNLDCAKYISKNVSKGSTILLKASRLMKFEQIIDEVDKFTGINYDND